MRRNPHMEDYSRRIKIVFYSVMDDVVKEYLEYFPSEYYEISGVKSLRQINMSIYSETPDLIVCPDNIKILSDKVERYLFYVDQCKLNLNHKEVSKLIKNKAYEKYITKIKNQIEYIIRNNNGIDKISKKIISLLDLKERYFKDHSIRVASYSLLVGKKLNFTSSELEKLKYSALLHDIGLLALPTSLITKPGNYSYYEMNLYKYHPIIGEYLLSFPIYNDIKNNVKLHHERPDGLGFLQYKDDDIPLCSQIISICDTFDLLTTSNFLRNRMSFQDALDKLAKFDMLPATKHKHEFNYEIAHVFIETMKEHGEIFVDMVTFLNNL